MTDFSTIEQIIEQTKKNLRLIKTEFDVYYQYQLNNPEYVFEVIENLKREKISPLPTFDEMITFKTGYLIDNQQKVYAQIKHRNPSFLNRGPEALLYYTVENGLFLKQQEEDLELGDLDKQGRIVSGSNLIIKSLNINFQEFLGSYYSLHN